ncbi:MAG TPA: MFS transporter [Candidatus Limnocylindria bacterium]
MRSASSRGRRRRGVPSRGGRGACAARRRDRDASVGRLSLPRDVRILVLVQLIWGLGFGLIGPIQPLYLQSLGADPSQIGLVFGVGNIVGGLLVLPAGFVADRFGRRLIIIASGTSGTIGALTLVVIDRWEWAILSSVLYWVGIAALPAMSAHIAAVAPRALLGRAMGAMYGAFFLGLIVASPFAGAIADRIGMRSTILIGALFFALSTAADLGLTPGRVARTVGAAARFPRSFWILLSLAPIGGFVAVLATPLLPVYVREVVGAPLEQVGLYVACLSLGSALFSAAGGRLSDRFGAASAVVANALIVTTGCAIAALFASSGPLVAVGLILVGANVGSTPVLAALLERVVPSARSAVGYAAFQLVYTIGYGIGGIAAGTLYDTDPHLPFLVTIALGLPIAMVVAFVVARIARRGTAALPG